MMCGQIYKTIWNDQWETAGILEKYHTVPGELQIIPLYGNVVRGGGGGPIRWYRQYTAIGHARHFVQLPRVLHKTGLNRAVSLCILQGTTPFLPLFCAVLLEKRGYPTPENAILHPILHPKLPVNTGYSGYGCRKCMIFSKNFFFREERYNGPEVTKHRTSLGKSTDVLHRKYGCLPQRSPMFFKDFVRRGPPQSFPSEGLFHRNLFVRRRGCPGCRRCNTVECR